MKIYNRIFMLENIYFKNIEIPTQFILTTPIASMAKSTVPKNIGIVCKVPIASRVFRDGISLKT